MTRQLVFVLGLLCLNAASASPVTKVVELIKELKSKIETDERTEQKVYNKFACWCESTTQRKSDAINTAKDDIGTLGSKVMENKGKAASMASQIATLTSDIRKNEEAQQRATAIREKENTDYAQEKAEMQQAIEALDKALVTVKPSPLLNSAASLLKLGVKGKATAHSRSMELLGAAAGVKSALNELPEAFQLSPEKLMLVDKFMKDPVSYLAQKAEIESGANEAYDPQSVTIASILKEMHDSFKTTLEAHETKEADGQSSFEEIMATKSKELATMKDVLASREAIRANANVEYADASQELQNTEAQMKADTDFFAETKKACEDKAAEWEERQRLRQGELKGITKALDVLTSDDARALFGKAIKPGMETFLQTGSSVEDSRTAKVVSLLKKSHSVAVQKIATQLSTGAMTGHDFSRIIGMVEKQIKQKEKEEQEDIDQRDWCKESIFVMETEKSRYAYKIEKHEAKITKLNEQKDELENSIAETKAEILATEEELAQMTSDRQDARGLFKQTKADDEAAAELLRVAIHHLSKFYEDEGIELGGMQQDADTIASQGGASLLQKKHEKAKQPTFDVSEDQAPDASFSSGDKSAGESKGIISILTMLREDTLDEVKNGIKAEDEAEATYQDQKKAAKTLIKDLNAKVTDLEGSVAERNTEIEGEETGQGDTETDLDEKTTELNEIMPNCDFIIRNFQLRRDMRKKEINGLHEAIAMMSGMGGTPGTGGAFVQKDKFDDAAFSKHSFRGLAFLQK